ncbi:hypothetical protein HanIR_Chr02g0062011 [Helianthus annuus]|nr:hypothetical protein HanIR_Chr02g0062011 [Helianthus annuus]
MQKPPLKKLCVFLSSFITKHNTIYVMVSEITDLIHGCRIAVDFHWTRSYFNSHCNKPIKKKKKPLQECVHLKKIHHGQLHQRVMAAAHSN